MALNTRSKVLVTGGAGFLGSHLCERLLDEGHALLCIDNFRTGRIGNVEHLLANPRFECRQHDVTEPLQVDVAAIYNLACPASPRHYQQSPVQTTRTSVLGAFNMLDLAVRNNCRIFQASTSEVYGDPDVHPQSESYWGNVNPMGQRACYDEGKRCAEALFSDYRRQYGARIKVARIFNTYGPRMQLDDGRVVSNFIVQALQNQPITIHGTGNQTRSFCFVEDMIEGILRMMASAEEFTGPVNLGNDEECTILELAQLIVELTGSRAPITFHPAPEDDPKQRKPDIRLARQHLDWQPSTRLRDGLARSIPYFEGLLRSPADGVC